jgi:hypothetical protein
MGRPLPGVRAFVDGGELVVDPATVPKLAHVDVLDDVIADLDERLDPLWWPRFRT